MLRKVIYSNIVEGLYLLTDNKTDQNHYYIFKEVEKATKFLNKKNNLFRTQSKRQDITYAINRIYRLIIFCSYGIIEDEKFVKDVLKAIEIDELRITEYVNKKAIILDIDKNKTRDEAYIELISTLYLFGDKTENIIKTSGYTPRPIFSLLKNIHIAELIFLSGVLELYANDKRGIKMLIYNILKK